MLNYIPTINFWHHQVEQDDVRSVGLYQLDGFLATVGFLDFDVQITEHIHHLCYVFSNVIYY